MLPYLTKGNNAKCWLYDVDFAREVEVLINDQVLRPASRSRFREDLQRWEELILNPMGVVLKRSCLGRAKLWRPRSYSRGGR